MVSAAVGAAIRQAQARAAGTHVEVDAKAPVAEAAVAPIAAKPNEPDIGTQQAQRAQAQLAHVAADYEQHVERMLNRSGINTTGMSLDAKTDALEVGHHDLGNLPRVPDFVAQQPSQSAGMAVG